MDLSNNNCRRRRKKRKNERRTQIQSEYEGQYTMYVHSRTSDANFPRWISGVMWSNMEELERRKVLADFILIEQRRTQKHHVGSGGQFIPLASWLIANMNYNNNNPAPTY
jgi:hypothetical protein